MSHSNFRLQANLEMSIKDHSADHWKMKELLLSKHWRYVTSQVIYIRYFEILCCKPKAFHFLRSFSWCLLNGCHWVLNANCMDGNVILIWLLEVLQFLACILIWKLFTFICVSQGNFQQESKRWFSQWSSVHGTIWGPKCYWTWRSCCQRYLAFAFHFDVIDKWLSR